MEAILIPIFIFFGLPVGIVFIRAYFRLREKQLDAEQQRLRLTGNPQSDSADRKRAADLEARIQNLESIVCSVDFELNQRLNRLAAQASQRLQRPGLPDPGPSGGASNAAQQVDSPRRPYLPPGNNTPGRRGGQGPGQAGKGLLADAATDGYGLGELTPGQEVLSRYTVERELGRGGMGAVYLASDAKLGERVALKTISSLSSGGGDAAELAVRIRREVQAARRVTHPNIIRIHDLHEDGPLLFLSMEYIDGETLFARVRRLGPLSIPEARRVLSEIAAGVAAAHQVGVIHRDLKPHNVLLGKPARYGQGKGQGMPGPDDDSAEKSVKVIDFGIAQAAFADGATTGTGIILGTPEYMAPEQIRGGKIDARTDVYALGAMAHFALLGQPPFVGDTPIAVAFAQVQEEPRPPRSMRPDIPEDFSAAILLALSKDPGARHPDAAAFRRAICA